jgi:hypothetical protein
MDEKVLFMCRSMCHNSDFWRQKRNENEKEKETS